jgi:hypothetical protein
MQAPRIVVHPSSSSETSKAILRRLRKLREKRGFCNCCGRDVPLLTEPETGDSVCKICRSYDVRVQR